MKNFFQVIEASGSNYDIGYAIGKGTKKQIEKLIEILTKDYKKHTKKDFSNFIKSAQKFLEINQKQFPQYVEEIRGIGDGAGISFEQAFALSCPDELAWDDPTNSLAEKCSTFITKIGNDVFLCHNEDYAATFLGMLYVVKAKQKNKPSFMSIGYVGTLPGSSIGMNDAGIAVSGNWLGAKDCRIGILNNFVYRSILDCKSVEEAIHLIRKTKRAIGGNYEIASEKKCVNIETTATKDDVFIINKFPHFHTNHYLSEKLKKLQRFASESSFKRYERLQELKNKLKSFNDIKKILSDHKYKLPICRHEGLKDSTESITLGSTIVNISKGKFYVAKGNPCKNEYVEINF